MSAGFGRLDGATLGRGGESLVIGFPITAVAAEPFTS